MSEEFNPSEFFDFIRKSASVKAGAVIFGQAQIAYYDTLKQAGWSDEQAYSMTAHTSEVLVRSVLAAVPPLTKVAVEAAALWEALGYKQPAATEKKVPGSES